MPNDYTMQKPKENTYEPNLNDYISYLCKECLSKTTDANTKIYHQITQFVKTQEGKLGFKQFRSLNPEKVGIYKKIEVNPVNKVFKL